MNALKKTDKAYWLLLGLLGLLVIIFHRQVGGLLTTLAGIGLVVVGVIGLIGWWGMREDKSANVIGQLVGALLLVGFGIWALTHRASFTGLLNIAAAAILIWTCIQRLVAIKGFKLDKVTATVCVVGIVLGALILFGRLDLFVTGPIIVGCGLLYTACVGLMKLV